MDVQDVFDHGAMWEEDKSIAFTCGIDFTDEESIHELWSVRKSSAFFRIFVRNVRLHHAYIHWGVAENKG
jgi:hypothetical protein